MHSHRLVSTEALMFILSGAFVLKYSPKLNKALFLLKVQIKHWIVPAGSSLTDFQTGLSCTLHKDITITIFLNIAIQHISQGHLG